jgi:hypothetical protein
MHKLFQNQKNLLQKILIQKTFATLVAVSVIMATTCVAATSPSPASLPSLPSGTRATHPVQGAQCAVPLILDTYATSLNKTFQYTLDADKRRHSVHHLAPVLGTIAKNKGWGGATPMAVLLDPGLSLNDVSGLVRIIQRSGMRNVRYFVYQQNRLMVAELRFGAVNAFPDNAFPRSRLDSEMMAAPR